MNKTSLFLHYNFLDIPSGTRKGKPDNAMLGTVLSNMAYFGYAPSADAIDRLGKLSNDELVSFWTSTETALKELTGANRKMDKFVVYKNFPKEVLDMSFGEYWVKQILMYIGFPNVLFTEEEQARPPLLEGRTLKILQSAPVNALGTIWASLVENASRWSDNQTDHAKFVANSTFSPNRITSMVIDLDTFKFKENGLVLIVDIINNKSDTRFSISNATDVLRLCAALSDADISLRTKAKFRNFKRSERRHLLSMLENSKNLLEDVTLRPESWKRLLSKLHPGDYAFENVKSVYNKLYTGDYTTFNSLVDAQTKTPLILDVLATRPGEFMRRMHSSYSLFGMRAIHAFCEVVPKLKTIQLLKLRSYAETINDRATLMYPPKGNWARSQIVPNEKKKLSGVAKKTLLSTISSELKSRLNEAFPKGVKLDPATKNIKLQTNDQKLAEYGRGTVFNIPENMTFIRSASYWAATTDGWNNIWFDNGWNFFDGNWNVQGCCAWNDTNFHKGASIFSGDPTNSKDMKGRACQMIDLYIDKLVKAGVRYAVWNVLCYSRVPFNKAEDVLATLQWGEKATSGKLYEPSRAQMVFPLKGDKLTKYVAYIDLVERKLVYMDADFNGNVMSASTNGPILQQKMPAYLEYMNSLPSIADLFANAKKGKTPILYSDENVEIATEQAYVFRQLNQNNSFKKIEISELL